MEQKTGNKRHYFLKAILLIAAFAGIIYYAFSFPTTMKLLDEAVGKILKTAGIETEFSAFSDFSEFSKETVEKALYLIEILKNNAEENVADGKKIPVAIITCAAKFPSEGERITSDFGEREDPISGENGDHNGIDIAAAFGSEVTAAWPGIVAETGFDEIYGNYVVIEHSEGFFTKYCHLSVIKAANKAFVNAGEKIGEAGSTGRSTGSHLHFEVSIGGRNIDPKECFGL
ncbi:MAG: M23 family metallopeptidase [Oscillospiraceae bacterium]|nr:M23 family metallopeptidase [Oscillospiraceae bacterium]